MIDLPLSWSFLPIHFCDPILVEQFHDFKLSVFSAHSVRSSWRFRKTSHDQAKMHLDKVDRPLLFRFLRMPYILPQFLERFCFRPLSLHKTLPYRWQAYGHFPITSYRLFQTLNNQSGKWSPFCYFEGDSQIPTLATSGYGYSLLIGLIWRSITNDPMTTTAAIDRLAHHSVVLGLNVLSYRADQARKFGKSSPAIGWKNVRRKVQTTCLLQLHYDRNGI